MNDVQFDPQEGHSNDTRLRVPLPSRAEMLQHGRMRSQAQVHSNAAIPFESRMMTIGRMD